VITVANTFIATIEAITLTGATPVFVDVDPATGTMDPNLVMEAITPRTRALLPVHLYGQAADMRPLCALARHYDLKVIEDASQAQGARYDGQRVGTLGDMGAFSFYFSKNLGAYGEAGIVTTHDPMLGAQVRMLRDHGSHTRYYHEALGINSRLDELQAAVLRIKLRRLDEWNRRRQVHAAVYTERLQGLVTCPFERPGSEHVYYAYVIQAKNRERLRAELAEQGIQTGIHYPRPLHLQQACAAFACTPGSLPVTEHLANRILSIPMFPELTEAEIERVCEGIQANC